MWRLLLRRRGNLGYMYGHYSHRPGGFGTGNKGRRRPRPHLPLGTSCCGGLRSRHVASPGTSIPGDADGERVASIIITPDDSHPATTTTTPISSIGFSGAGFLGAYHLGAMDCLVEQGILLAPGEVPPSTTSTPPPGTTTTADDDGGGSSSGVLLLGASAGSITSAAISAGVRADDGMGVVLELAKRTRTVGGILDVLRPGFSLIDNVFELMVPAMRDAVGGDEELLLRRIDHGRLLRIALTDRMRLLPSLGGGPSPTISATATADDALESRNEDSGGGGQPKVKIQTPTTPIPGNTVPVSDAYCYVDRYRDVDDVIAACILSSYIPGLTGPTRGASCPINSAVRGACARLDELTRLGAVKWGSTGLPVDPTPSSVRERSRGGGDDGGVDEDDAVGGGGDGVTVEERFLDGGLSNVWPTADDSTVVVSPIGGSFDPNPAITPRMGDGSAEDGDEAVLRSQLELSTRRGRMDGDSNGGGADAPTNVVTPPRAADAVAPWNFSWHGRSIRLDMQNAVTLWRMALSSDDATLERRFRNGHDDARAFLNRHGLIKVHKN